VPKALRKKLSIQPGQKVYLSSNKKGDIIIQTSSKIDEIYGSMKGAWGPDSTKYIRELRDEADRDRT
jgi:bifunctional DNA-binding transcriptional regulator/antitoxin component of YhaV-PrlF toxin-antitoxin module